MAQYPFSEIEKKWQTQWAKTGLYKVLEDPQKPKYYVLDMFPYPSGAGLHVGHPLGYIASDIVSRYKRLKGFNVLHPMGYDAFGLPAEQYAIQTGQHPAKTTAANIETFRRQLDLMGFSYDWSREVRTCEPEYYRWTQWIFGQFFNHWYDKQTDKARPIAELENQFSLNGTSEIHAACSEPMQFTAAEWNVLSPKMKSDVLNNYRLAFIDFTTVNWCQELGCVLANEEVVNHAAKGPVSERGGYPVVRKKMKQWSLRITAYADRLLKGLDSLDWSDSIKEIQRNWIGRSEGAEIQFTADSLQSTVIDQHAIEVFTTRPDTLFGATFLVLAPEYEGLYNLCSDEQREAVKAYAEAAKNRSEIDRMADTRKTGIFTGAYAKHPFTGKPIPVWVSDYVLAGYGTGAIMAVPAHDDRDFEFAKAFNLPIVPVIKPVNEMLSEPLTEAFSAKDGVCYNSDFLDGLNVKEAIQKAIKKVENEGLGKRKVNYKLREAGFGRQRYWGEPFPIVFDNDQIPHLINDLPVELPKVESYKPTGTGESPLAGVKEWVEVDLDDILVPAPQAERGEIPIDADSRTGRRETDTMPGWAGSSWYFLRYMDPGNQETFAGQSALNYWKQVDLYVGGSEHATGHLLYSRFWTKFLFDMGYLSVDEPFKKLVNQGMIMGEDGQKMSKRWGNVVNPDDVCAQYGADTLRMYEMFLGPLTDSKPWNTNGIEGVSRFLNKFWRLFEQDDIFPLTDEIPTKDELKILHKTIKKITADIEQMGFNTAVSAFMVATNELGALQCKKRGVLEPLIILIAPFAPHIAEELWQKCGHTESVHLAQWPNWDDQYLAETHFEYPISINGKTRTSIAFDLNADAKDIEAAVLADAMVQRWMEGKPLKKFILVKGRIINVVV